jgi:hypothetical protein
MIYFLFIIISSFFEVLAMILIKRFYLNKLNFENFKFNNLLIYLFHPYVLFGIFLFFISIVIFFYTLTKINLLFFFCYFSVSKLIFAFYLSEKFLNEKVNKRKIIALAMLFISLFMVSYN